MFTLSLYPCLQLSMGSLADKLYSFTTATNTNMLKVVMTAVEGQWYLLRPSSHDYLY
jgi:hypothetical protein